MQKEDRGIIDFISQYVELTEEERRIIVEQNVFRSCRKNELLLSEGELARDCFFVIRGCVRAYYLIDGEERNTDFFFENDAITPISYQTGEPSKYFLSTLENSVIAIGNEERNRKLVAQIPALSSLVAQMNQHLLIKKTVEFDQFKNLNPEERYMKLLENQPELLQRIPLYHLATYLGITQMSLSRIRARIVKKYIP